MKKAIIVGILIISLLCIGLLSGCGWHYGLFNLCSWSSSDSTFNNCINSLHNPEEIYNYMKPPNWTYQAHNTGINPHKAWAQKQGDCKEWTIFATYVALQHGYETCQIIMTFKKYSQLYGHVIPVFKEGDSYTYIDIYHYYEDDCFGVGGNKFYSLQDIVDECEKHHFGYVTKWIAFDECFNIIEQFKDMVRRR